MAESSETSFPPAGVPAGTEGVSLTGQAAQTQAAGDHVAGDQAAGHGSAWPVLAAAAAVIAGTALLGVAAGFIWAAVAPRAVIVVAGPGSADVLNPETAAYIVADGWFILLSVAGGVVSGLAGYLLAVRRHGPVAMAAVLAGGVAAALIARWIGQQSGAAAANHSLDLGRAGTLLNQPLSLGGAGALMFWPLAAGLVAGGVAAGAELRARLRAQRLAGDGAPAGSSAPHTPGG